MTLPLPVLVRVLRTIELDDVTLREGAIVGVSATRAAQWVDEGRAVLVDAPTSPDAPGVESRAAPEYLPDPPVKRRAP